VAWAETYPRTKWHFDPSSRLTTIHCRNWGALCPTTLFWGGSNVLIEHNVAWAEAYLRIKWHLIYPAVWPQQTWAEYWRAAPLLGRASGCSSNTMWPRPRPASMPSFILIHPTGWPQYTNVADTQDRQTDRQWSDSIGRTVLQTVAQKPNFRITVFCMP